MHAINRQRRATFSIWVFGVLRFRRRVRHIKRQRAGASSADWQDYERNTAFLSNIYGAGRLRH